MAAKYPEELQTKKDSIDDIKPESISNVTGPTSSVTSSIARIVKVRRAISAAKLQPIEEVAALAEMERKLNMTEAEEGIRIKKRKPEIEDKEKLKRLEAEQKQAFFEVVKGRDRFKLPIQKISALQSS